MATLEFRSTLTDLKWGARTQWMAEGSEMTLMVDAFRQIVHDALAEGAATRYLDQFDKVVVWGEFQSDTGPSTAHFAQDDTDTTVTFRLVAQVMIRDDLLADWYAEDGDVRPYLDAVGTGLGEAFAALPNSGADLYAAMGVVDPANQITVSLTVRNGLHLAL